jgi:uncharacterized membrane protein YphA (DoxX/SURF4 family)
MIRIFSFLLGAIFLAAACAKVLKPGPLSFAVGYLANRWGGVSLHEDTVRVLIAGVIVVESAFGVLLMLGWRRRLVAACAFGLLIGLTGVMVLLAIDPAAPTCGCFGEIKMASDARAINALGLVRNAALIALSGIILLSRSGTNQSVDPIVRPAE